jgi:hypothetical protein
MPGAPTLETAAQWKVKARAAWQRARKANSVLPQSLVDRLWTDSLIFVRDMPERGAVIVWRESAWLFELIIARARWIRGPG